MKCFRQILMIHLISPVCKVSVLNYSCMRYLFIGFLNVEKKDEHYTILIMHLFNKEDIYNIATKETILKGAKSREFQYSWHKHTHSYILLKWGLFNCNHINKLLH
jgi:hypothetical protein